MSLLAETLISKLIYLIIQKTLKNATWVDTSKLSAKSDLTSLKALVDKTDVEKLKIAPVDLSKLSNVVNHEVFKKTVYDKVVAKVNNIDTSGFILKTEFVNQI